MWLEMCASTQSEQKLFSSNCSLNKHERRLEHCSFGIEENKVLQILFSDLCGIKNGILFSFTTK